MGDAMHRFKDRAEAGHLLAHALASRAIVDPVILALPRGGVPVAAEIAREMRAPLDLVMVRKIGLPGLPEVAVAAIVNGSHPELVINDSIAAEAGLDRAAIEALAEPELAEIRRRRGLYLAGRAHEPLAGRVAVIVDDGVATGATARAAIAAVRRQGPRRVVLAVPVAAPEAVLTLRGLVDDLVCIAVPRDFYAVGAHYDSFDQVQDAEVVLALHNAAAQDRHAGRVGCA